MRWARLAWGVAALGGLALGTLAGMALLRPSPPPLIQRSLLVQPSRIYASPTHPADLEALGLPGEASASRVPLRLLGAVYPPAARDREPVALHRVPRVCVDAVLVVEDRRFFEHSGLDPRRVAGAALANLRAGRIVQGGSTLTQQLVKNLYLSRERTFARKWKEALLALRLERATDKAEILQAYLNEVYLGQRGRVAVHGLAAGARHWFGRDLEQLGVAECAWLAGLIRGPNSYAPWRAPARALTRRNRVLALLFEDGHIDESEYVAAAQMALPAGPQRQPERGWFIDAVRRELRDRYPARELSSGGLRVITTLDARLQMFAERSVRDGLAALEAEHARLADRTSPLQAALVALDPERGDVLALVGGRDYARSQFNRALHARRQPGSVFKPVVALAALEPGADGAPVATLDTLLLDAPLRVPRPDGSWSPTNYDRRFRGHVTLQEALERSLNVPMVRLGRRVGAEEIASVATRLGIASPLEVVPALALGASEVTLLEMTRAYAVLAAEGVSAEPRMIQLVLDPQGRRVHPEPVARWRAFEASPARLVTRALRGAVERGTGRRLRVLGIQAPVAGKTGSTSGFRDAWFIGYTPELVVGVWVGFDDGFGIGLPGSRAALPIFAAFLREALPENEAPFHADTAPDDPITEIAGSSP